MNFIKFGKSRKQDERTYHSRKPFKTLLFIILAAALLSVILLISVYFGFKQYIVHTDDGIRLDIPWLEGATAEIVDNID